MRRTRKREKGPEELYVHWKSLIGSREAESVKYIIGSHTSTPQGCWLSAVVQDNKNEKRYGTVAR